MAMAPSLMTEIPALALSARSVLASAKTALIGLPRRPPLAFQSSIAISAALVDGPL